MNLHSSRSVVDCLEILNKSSVQWMLLWNISSELPSRLPLGKDIDILVKPESAKGLLRILGKHNYQLLPHPTRFVPALYGMPRPFMMRSLDHVLLDINPCIFVRSLDQGQLFPLDQYIQEEVWKNPITANINGTSLHMPSAEISLALSLSRAIFNHKKISPPYISHLKSLFPLCDLDQLRRVLLPVFFGATDFIMLRLADSDYSDLAQDYFQNSNY